MNNTYFTIVTGRAGSGKSTALAAFEDSGHYCIDNMPVVFLPQFLNLPIDKTDIFNGLTFGMDVRDDSFVRDCAAVLDTLKRKGMKFRILFLEADENVLIRRFNQTRRKHPLSIGKSIQEAIQAEKAILTPIREKADQIIDTSTLNVHELKAIVRKIANQDSACAGMQAQVLSFGFKFGLPAHADLVMDVRFLENPYFVEALRPLSGENEKIRSFVLNNANTGLFLQRYIDLLDILIPQYENEGKAYLTIAIGCTGGRHRSVVIARQIYDHLLASGRKAELTHRDIDKFLST